MKVQKFSRKVAMMLGILGIAAAVTLGVASQAQTVLASVNVFGASQALAPAPRGGMELGNGVDQALAPAPRGGMELGNGVDSALSEQALAPAPFGAMELGNGRDI